MLCSIGGFVVMAMPATVQIAGAGIVMLASLPAARLALGVAGLSVRRAKHALIKFDLRLPGVFALLLAGVFAVVVPTAG